MTPVRVALLSDVHANLPALLAARRRLELEQPDLVLVAGDLVGYGGFPNECIEVLQDMGAVCVAGNHDLLFTGRLPPSRFPAVARHAAAVTGPRLGRDARRYLAELPLNRRVGRFVIAHGSLDDPEEYVEDPARGRDLLTQAALRWPGTDVLVLGHTHRQWEVRGTPFARPRARLVNPGGVGQSRERERRPQVRLALFRSDTDSLSFLAVDYDVETAAARLRELGLSRLALHHPPDTRTLVAQQLPAPARRAARRVRRRLASRRSA
ncbi:metallophosphoesterase [Egicoccus sp. AB-alg2]|uniref:metallophosphoesterase family protein n=1 Tax=Egicoccus sp. AB-alg2 TaxID=3242693 RepID=UPI00359EFE27